MKAFNFILNLNTRMWELIASAIVYLIAGIVVIAAFLCMFIYVSIISLAYCVNIIRTRFSRP